MFVEQFWCQNELLGNFSRKKLSFSALVIMFLISQSSSMMLVHGNKKLFAWFLQPVNKNITCTGTAVRV